MVYLQIIWQIGNMAILEIDPDLNDIISQLIENSISSTNVTFLDFKTFFGEDSLYK